MSIWRVIKSVLAAFFGVQKEARRHEDFQRESATPFILVGLVLGFVLIVVIAMVARLAAG